MTTPRGSKNMLIGEDCEIRTLEGIESELLFAGWSDLALLSLIVGP